MNSSVRLSAVFFVALGVLAFASFADAEDVRRTKKLIEVGWDMPDSETLPKILDEVEKAPFDGLVVQVVGRKSDGASIKMGFSFLNEKWQREWFQPAVDQLRSCKFRRFTDNFVLVNANPGNVDWFDDVGWQNIVEHWRIAAWVARQSGFKGICFDPEPYALPNAQFEYDVQPGKNDHTFAEYCEKARQRGREVMKVIAEEYPDMTILSFFMNSSAYKAIGQADPRQALATLQYGLLPAMLDGWLDVAPPTLTVVDGCEPAYLYNSSEAFLASGNLIRNVCQDFVSPQNRAKYRAQVQVGFSIYMDAYSNPKGSTWYIDGGDKPRVERLFANVRNAFSVADEYVWVYGEKYRWWPTSPNSIGPSKDCVDPQSWIEALPGCDNALRCGRDPIGYARAEVARLQAAGQSANLARNGDFSSEKSKSFAGQDVAYSEGGCPAGWSSWQDEKSNGTFTWDRPKSAARIAGVSNGCLIQEYPVEPGQRYAISASQRVEGRGQGTIAVRWRDAEGKWLHERQDSLILPQPGDAKDSSSSSNLFGVACVPDGAGRLVILPSAWRQQSESDVIWYDDIEVYKLP